MRIAAFLFAAAAVGLAATSAMAAFSGSAVVNSNGSLARSVNVRSAKSLGEGEYQVLFTRSVTACAYTAAIGVSTPSAESAGTVSVVGRSDHNNGVYVETFDTAGNPAKLGFYIIVAC